MNCVFWFTEMNFHFANYMGFRGNLKWIVCVSAVHSICGASLTETVYNNRTAKTCAIYYIVSARIICNIITTINRKRWNGEWGTKTKLIVVHTVRLPRGKLVNVPPKIIKISQYELQQLFSWAYFWKKCGMSVAVCSWMLFIWNIDMRNR